jgi:hypothetical protein
MERLITPELYAGRILRGGGKITDLSSVFKFDNDESFTLFIIPNSTGTTANDKTVIINCKCYNNDTSVNIPFTLNCWDSPLVKEISINGIDLTKFDVYWGLGK